MKLAIFGYGGHAREVYWSLDLMKRVGCKFFVDDEYYQGGVNILPISEFDPTEYQMMVAVGDSEERKKIVKKLPKKTSYFTFIHPTAQIMAQDVTIGQGSFIGANSILTTNIKIGEHTILNRGNQIGHDTKIGNYFSSMPGSIVSGNVEIGDCVYLGTNATIKEKIQICDNVKIGSGGAVVKNINEEGIYVGVPVKKIK
jgi:sugar O-acyltransferase (sialic acid O-acetyltransferase NeuD family)